MTNKLEIRCSLIDKISHFEELNAKDWCLDQYSLSSLSRSPSLIEAFKMALASIGVKTNIFILPFAVSVGRCACIRSISKMASSCKAGRNKRREVKVS